MSVSKIFYVLIRMWGSMKILWGVLIIFIGFQAQAMGPLPISKQVIPDSRALLSWQEIPGYQNTEIDPMSIERISLKCADTRLFPTHPQQNTKLYHLFLSGRYDHTKLAGEDEACAMSSKYSNAKGVKACLRPDWIEYAVLSDLYTDSCGHLYRGFWDVAYLKTHDNMGVLFSKGRTLYPKPDSGNLNDMFIGGTYTLDVHDFLFLSPLLPKDAEQINKLQTEAVQTQSLKDHLWAPR